MAEKDINGHIFNEEDPTLDLDIKTEIRFSKKNLPKGEMVPVFVDGKKEYVLIPLDIKDGTTLTVSGGGKHNPRSGTTGDLHVLVHISENKTFPWKIILPAVAVLMVILLLAVLMLKKPASETTPTTEPIVASCEHVWTPADCTTPKTCSKCGETSGEPIDHDWNEATYDAPKTCNICGATDGVAKKPVLKIGDMVSFGSYEQDGLRKNGAEPIEWIVLDIQNNQALLLSRYALDSRPYNSTYSPVTWETCSLRDWLNDIFLNTAFTEDEKKQILLTEVDNSRTQGNNEWHISGGNNTEDAVFLLSYADTDRYFDSAYDRLCMPTDYAISNGAKTRVHDDNITESGWWWLRSPGEAKHHAAFVNFDGTCYSNAVGNEYLSVRPALWISLDGE
ncbi:MAG: hypothetical protein IKA09_11165 [Lachnospiraceae bacterium]|nr:hypothetical protein [Lachnospiraceae bacterium]